MKTERTKELLRRFKDYGISHDPNNGLQFTLEYQDCIGHATEKEIYEFYESLNQPERELFFWSNGLTLCYDMAVRIMKFTTIASMRKREQEDLTRYFEEKFKELDSKVRVFEENRKHVWKRIDLLREQVRVLKVNLQHAKDDKGRAWKNYYESDKENRTLREKAKKFDTLKGLLA